MAPSIIHLPDGQNFTVTPVFAGLFFKSHELNTHNSPFPIGWTVVLHTEEEEDDDDGDGHDSASTPALNGASRDGDDVDMDASASASASAAASTSQHQHHNRPGPPPHRKSHIHSYTKPTLQSDSLFISSISNPSTSDFKPATSPTRQIAMMLWVTLYWYFHQPEPSKLLPPTDQSRLTADAGRPRGDWRINIKRDGVLRGRNLIPKLERMGLIMSMDSAAGTAMDDNEGWAHMFISRKVFWQIPGRQFLFTLQPQSKSAGSGSSSTGAPSSHPGSPVGSRPGSPVSTVSPHGSLHAASLSQSQFASGADVPGAPVPTTLTAPPSFPIGPFFSTSHLPTYYPPAPLQYTITNHARHPVRPKPPRMGEVFYTRFVPSVGQYLAFRVASASTKPVPYLGPVNRQSEHSTHLATLSDTSLLQMWLGNPRVQKFWGGYVPDFLTKALQSRHSFPVIGMWDGVPFGYFEIYWVKEDLVGRYIGGSEAGDFDRGVHVLIGEEWARGRVQSWLTSLVHALLGMDYRTMSVCCEPRVDNARFIQHLQYAGFVKEREIAFPHKQAWFGRLRREDWDGPSL